MDECLGLSAPDRKVERRADRACELGPARSCNLIASATALDRALESPLSRVRTWEGPRHPVDPTPTAALELTPTPWCYL
jgi:hypothetical protein